MKHTGTETRQTMETQTEEVGSIGRQTGTWVRDVQWG